VGVIPPPGSPKDTLPVMVDGNKLFASDVMGNPVGSGPTANLTQGYFAPNYDKSDHFIIGSQTGIL